MFQKISEGIYALFGSDFVKDVSSNIYLLLGKRTALIDSGNQAGSEYLLESLNSLGLKAGNIDLILHTHGHADHFSGDILFKKSEIIMHEFDAGYVNIKDELFTASGMLGTTFFPKIGSFFKENEIVSVKPFELKVVFTPGHTQGSVCFFDESRKILFSGDTLFNKNCGRFDLASGNKRKLVSSLLKLKELDFNVLFPGHGEIVFEKQQENADFALKIADDNTASNENV